MSTATGVVATVSSVTDLVLVVGAVLARASATSAAKVAESFVFSGPEDSETMFVTAFPAGMEVACDVSTEATFLAGLAAFACATF